MNVTSPSRGSAAVAPSSRHTVIPTFDSHPPPKPLPRKSIHIAASRPVQAPTPPEASVRQVAMAQWRLRRLYHIEAAFFTARLHDLRRDFKTPQFADRLATIVRDDCRNANALVNLSRHEARLERAFYKALQELRRLRAQLPVILKNQTQFKREPPLLTLVPP